MTETIPEVAALEKSYNAALAKLKLDNPDQTEAQYIEELKKDKTQYRQETRNSAGEIVPGDFFYNIAREDYLKALDEYIENINKFARDLESRGY